MKFKWKMLMPLSLILSFGLASCTINLLKKDEPEPTVTILPDESIDYTVPTPETKGKYTVTFVCNNGYSYASTTDENNKILKPDDPLKVYATFKGWYIDKDCTNLFDFSISVSENTVLYAGWNIDYVGLINSASTESILANMRINVENYDMAGFGFKTQTNVSNTLGSGVIFYEENGYYYILTNNHVVYKERNYQTITVEDAYESSYTATLIASDANYDLAIIAIAKTRDLKVIPLAGYSLNTNDLVIAMGEPDRLSNIISLGYITGTKKFTPNQEDKVMSNVTFEVYMMSAPIQNGSSGGALLDDNLRLVGINFASAHDKDTNEFKYGYTIPAYKVREFIKANTDINI